MIIGDLPIFHAQIVEFPLPARVMQRKIGPVIIQGRFAVAERIFDMGHSQEQSASQLHALRTRRYVEASAIERCRPVIKSLLLAQFAIPQTDENNHGRFTITFVGNCPLILPHSLGVHSALMEYIGPDRRQNRDIGNIIAGCDNRISRFDVLHGVVRIKMCIRDSPCPQCPRPYRDCPFRGGSSGHCRRICVPCTHPASAPCG